MKINQIGAILRSFFWMDLLVRGSQLESYCLVRWSYTGSWWLTNNTLVVLAIFCECIQQWVENNPTNICIFLSHDTTLTTFEDV
jgi:hypothetical protein